jgi:hypothetical protein
MNWRQKAFWCGRLKKTTSMREQLLKEKSSGRGQEDLGSDNNTKSGRH